MPIHSFIQSSTSVYSNEMNKYEGLKPTNLYIHYFMFGKNYIE